jgi:hypothetical protein
MTKMLSVPVEEEVYDILQPLAELQVLGRLLADFAQRQKDDSARRNWVGKVYKVDSFQPLTREEVYER